MTALTPPPGLTLEARKIWREVNRRFEFEYEQLVLLKVALEHYDVMLRARGELLAQGFTIPASGGGEKAHPALRVFEVGRRGFLESWKALNMDLEPPGPVGRPPGT